MRSAFVCAAVVMASIWASPTSFSVEVGAWLTYWDLDRGLDRLDGPTGRGVEDVFLFSAALSSDGDVVLVQNEATVRGAIERSRRDGKRVWLTIVNDEHPAEAGARKILKNGELVHRILIDSTLQAAHRSRIVAVSRRLGVSGIDVDYENLDAADRERFTTFIASLSSALRVENIDLSVTVQPKTRESRSRGPGAADWRALCTFVDRLQVMLYNEHSGKTRPGPMATRDWMASVLRFALEQCDSSRIVPVLKVSGMEWSPAGVRGIQHEECVQLARVNEVAVARDGADQVPYFTYVSKDGPATVFFEDATSIEVKFRLIASMGFRKAVLWSLGREDPEILPRLTS